MADRKTQPTNASPAAFLRQVENDRRRGVLRKLIAVSVAEMKKRHA